MFAAAATVFAACSQNDELSAPAAGLKSSVETNAVGFDVYAGRGVTRAGVPGDITNTTIKTSGFGVFGYYTDNGEYDENISTPNFMYNQQITHDGSAWTYEPVKYWPNEYGSNAVSDETDKLTFFAYGPYVDVIPSTGKISSDADWGITGLTRNTASGDPLVKYIVSFDPAKSVDLVWGTVANETAYTSWAKTQGGNQTLTAGLPWLNVERPADATGASQKVKFDFKHATSKLNVQIAYYADKQDNSSSEEIAAADTKIYVRSITFTGIATKGALNLNNTVAGEALWMSYNGCDDLENSESVTVFDGRKDGKEGVSGAVASNEKITGLNTAVISNDGNTTAGVTKTLQNLFKDTAPVYVIPTGEAVSVEIVYDVETADTKLADVLSDGTTHGSSIENRIKKDITAFASFENGKAYTLNLYLGMNSVKIDATVSDWDSTTAAEDADLPANQN